MLKMLVRAWCVILGSITAATLILTAVVALTLHSQVAVFAQSAQVSLPELVTTTYPALLQPKSLPSSHFTLLILGTDYLGNRGDAPVLTDSIILISINTQNAKINLVSLPRDIFLPEQKLKINAVYEQARIENKPFPEKIAQQRIQDLTGVPIHATLVVTLDQVASLIDGVGGVTIDVPVAFTDTQFPRSDVDVTTITDPQLLFRTVSFQEGIQALNGQTALEYIRSRHASGTQGNDLARNERQQQVILALITSLKDKKTILDPVKLGRLYYFYQQNWQNQLPLPVVVGLGTQLFPARFNFTFTSHKLTEYPYDPQGLLVHPALSVTFGQWSYLIRDSQKFKATLSSYLY